MTIQGLNVSRQYTRGKRSISALRPTGFESSEGSFTVISGRSGSGKTTLLNILSGLLRPSEGSVLYGETDIYGLSDKELSEFRSRHIGFIPQGHSLIGSLTVSENVLLPTALSGADGSDVDSLLERLGISELGSAYPNELSGGELRRTAIARALVNSPDVVFADEPTNDLDDENTRLVFELLRDTARSGKTVIAVTHEPTAEEYADIVYRMDSGTLNRTE